MNAEIVAVGTELLLGQIANTNAQFISDHLAEIGVNVFYHTVVGDNPDRLSHVMEIAKSRSNLVILTGGLGPTKDDLTKEVIAKGLTRKLVIDLQAMQSIEEYYNKTGRIMTENNRKQALVIEGSQILANKTGMAPGMLFEDKGITFVLMPGVPSEMKPMFLESVKPPLAARSGNPLRSRVLRFFGIGESTLETEIMDLIDGQSNPTIAPLAKAGEVTIRLTAKHSDEKAAEHLLDGTEGLIRERVGDFLYGYGETTLAEVVFSLLKENGVKLAIAESLTGGLFSKQITDFPGASDIFMGGIVSYTNEVKHKLLGISEDLLKTEGAVSGECAKQMAESARVNFGADLGLSFTGVAGPSPSEGKDVGTVFIGLANGTTTTAYPYKFSGTRSAIRHRTMLSGLDLIRRYLLRRDPFK